MNTQQTRTEPKQTASIFSDSEQMAEFFGRLLRRWWILGTIMEVREEAIAAPAITENRARGSDPRLQSEILNFLGGGMFRVFVALTLSDVLGGREVDKGSLDHLLRDLRAGEVSAIEHAFQLCARLPLIFRNMGIEDPTEMAAIFGKTVAVWTSPD